MAIIATIVLLFLTSCQSCDTVKHVYNIEHPQDPMCYAKFGGIHGYCDRRESDIK